jgi:Holliday junction resolvase-like predicted endonuclease
MHPLIQRLATWFGRKERPRNLLHGELGEREARRHLRRLGLKFLTANFRSERGGINLVFRECDCLPFGENA